MSKKEGIDRVIKDTFLKFFEHLFLLAIIIMERYSNIFIIIIGFLILIDILKIKEITSYVLEYRSMFGDKEE